MSKPDQPLSKHTRLLAIFITVAFTAAIQGLFIQSLWWWIHPRSPQELGWRVGFVYVLFCLFISGINILSAWAENSSHLAVRWRAVAMAKRQDLGATTACKILQELTQLAPETCPMLFLLPGREINAFSYRLGMMQEQKKGAIFVTRGALNQLSEPRLRILLARQLAQVRHPSCPLSSFTCLLVSGFCSLFLSGMTLLQHANLGRFERRKDKVHGSPIYYVGLIPMLLGLPGWWMARVILWWLNPNDCFEIDAKVATHQETASLLAETLAFSRQFPFEDTPPATWLMRIRGFHNEGFLEALIPLQPSIQERLQALEKIRLASKPR